MLKRLKKLGENRKARGWSLALAVLLSSAALVASALGAWDILAGVSFASFTLLGLVSLLLDQVVELKQKEPELEVYPDETSARPRQVQLLLALRPSCVAFIEYSTLSIEDILTACKQASIGSLYLLMRDPKYGLTDYQREMRINPGIIKLCGIFDLATLRTVRLRVKCYGDPAAASVRGRLFGSSFVSMGWYTYDNRFSNLPKKQIVGDLNPVLIARLASSEGAELARMFQQVFVSLWDQSLTIKDACARIPRPQEFPMDDWLDAVSPKPDERCPLFPASA